MYIKACPGVEPTTKHTDTGIHHPLSGQLARQVAIESANTRVCKKHCGILIGREGKLAHNSYAARPLCAFEGDAACRFDGLVS